MQLFIQVGSLYSSRLHQDLYAPSWGSQPALHGRPEWARISVRVAIRVMIRVRVYFGGWGETVRQVHIAFFSPAHLENLVLFDLVSICQVAQISGSKAM